MLIGGGAGRREFHVPLIPCQHIMIECFPVINGKNLACMNGSKSLGIKKGIRYLASSTLEPGGNGDRQGRDEKEACELPCTSHPPGNFVLGVPHTPLPRATFSSGSWSRGCPGQWQKGAVKNQSQPALSHLLCTSPNLRPA